MARKADLNYKLIESIYGIYSNAEMAMLERVAARSAKGIKTVGWTEEKLADVKALRRETEAIMSDSTKLAKKKLSDGIFKSYLSGVEATDKALKVPITAMKGLIPEHIQRLVLETNSLIEGTSLQILRNTQDVYRQVIAETSTGVLVGTETVQAATQSALNRFAARGVTGFVDKAGRRWDMASYAEMATRTVTSRAALQGHIDRQHELGVDLMRVSSIGATCPICAPWQGKILSISGNDTKYPSLESAKAAKLFHPNCKHTLMAYFPEMDLIEDTPEPNTDNDASKYKAIERQRENERQIRKYKRLQSVALSPAAEQSARNKVRQWQAIQRAHVSANDLKRKYYREGPRIGNASKDTGLYAGMKPILKPYDAVSELARIEKVETYIEHSKAKAAAKAAALPVTPVTPVTPTKRASSSVVIPKTSYLPFDELIDKIDTLPEALSAGDVAGGSIFTSSMSLYSGKDISAAAKTLPTRPSVITKEIIIDTIKPPFDLTLSKPSLKRVARDIELKRWVERPIVTRYKGEDIVTGEIDKLATFKLRGETKHIVDYLDLDAALEKEVREAIETAAKDAADKMEALAKKAKASPVKDIWSDLKIGEANKSISSEWDKILSKAPTEVKEFVSRNYITPSVTYNSKLNTAYTPKTNSVNINLNLEDWQYAIPHELAHAADWNHAKVNGARFSNQLRDSLQKDYQSFIDKNPDVLTDRYTLPNIVRSDGDAKDTIKDLFNSASKGAIRGGHSIEYLAKNNLDTAESFAEMFSLEFNGQGEILEKYFPQARAKFYSLMREEMGAPIIATLDDIPTLKNYKAYAEKRLADPLFAVPEKAIEVVKAAVQEAVPMVRVPGPATLDKIIKSGRFKSQHEISTSKGTYDPRSRKQASENMFGMDSRTLKDKDYEIYGYLWDKDSVIQDFAIDLPGQYGNIAVKLKKDIRSRATFTVNDSLGPASSDRIIPSLLDDVKNPFKRSSYEIADVVDIDLQDASVNQICMKTGARYMEAQYHGGVTLDDIEEVIYGPKNRSGWATKVDEPYELSDIKDQVIELRSSGIRVGRLVETITGGIKKTEIEWFD